MKKITSILLILSYIASILPIDAFALSTAVSSPENYPGKMDVKNVNGLGKNLTNDYFGGAMNFIYPFTFPTGSRGMTPSLSLSYSSNNSDAFSPYGYGFSLSLPRIQRSAKKGVSELYLGNEFSAFGNDLIPESGSQNQYRSKDANDLNLYTRTSSGWTVSLPDGKKLVFGANPVARVADPQNPEKIYAWMLEFEEDMFGHVVRYEYMQSGSQPLLSRVLYGFDTSGTNPIYEIRFSYIDKAASLSSYKTQFEVKTPKLLSEIALFASGIQVRAYAFTYDTPDVPVSHLVSITEVSGTYSFPKTEFSYGEGQFRHMITKVDNHRGGVAYFEYLPSTSYRTGSGDVINNRLPFVVMTLARQTLEDQITGLKSTETYEYKKGSYYYDSTDLWGREYVGFGEVSIRDDDREKVLFFHQSQTSDIHPLKFQDHIAKKGRVYLTRIYDIQTKKLLQEEYVRWGMKQISSDRRLVFPSQKVETTYSSEGSPLSKAETYEYDDVGNLIETKKYGWVSANMSDGTFVDVPGDEMRMVATYASHPAKNLWKFPLSEKIYGFSGELLRSTLNEYDQSGTGIVYGLVTKKQVIDTSHPENRIYETYQYSDHGLVTKRTDTLGNTTASTYDIHDIALVSTKNPLGWETKYAYNYLVGKPEQSTNQNNVITRTTYDAWGREERTFVNFDGTDILVSEKSYNDDKLPNSATALSYTDTSRREKKLQKVWFDGWGRTISTLSSSKDDGQYSLAHVRYDEDGNPIYASYPYFVSSLEWNQDDLGIGIRSGEQYRAKRSGVSYAYDALGRIMREQTSRGITEKTYDKNTETLTNALGYKTINSYDAYGNLVSVRENDGTRDIVTEYIYDALGRTVGLIDALGNIRNWYYDGLGRMTRSTDLHAPLDTTYGVRQYAYDALGRVSTYENANQEKISYTYDALGRVLTETIGDLGTREYTYDAGIRSLGTLSNISDTNTSVVYTYDALGRKISEVRNLEDKSYSLSYLYDLANAITHITYPDGGQALYGYKNGFAQTLDYIDPSGMRNSLITNITYSPNSTMNTVVYGNGVTKTIERDENYNHRLTRVRASLSGSSLLDTSYDYDAVSNISRIREAGIEPLRKTIDYTYDPLGRLVSANSLYAVSGYGRDTVKNLSYTYDSIGNILSASSVGNYLYSGEGYTNPHAVTTAGNASYTYDQAGNTLTRTLGSDIFSFTYSPYAEMLSSIKNGEKTTYTYDHTKRRVIKSSLGLLEHHVVDGYEVEYESGAVVAMNNEQVTPTNTGTTNTGSESGGVGIEGGGYSSGTANTGTTNTGTTSTGSTSTGSEAGGSSSGSTTSTVTTDTGSLISGSGITSTGSVDETNTGTTNTGSENLPPDNGGSTGSGSGESNSGTTLSGAVISKEQYTFIAGYEASSLSGATPATLTTTLTHIMLGDERIATFQTQADDSPKTLDDDKLIYHLSDHLNSSSLDLSSTGLLLQATDYEPFGKSIIYAVTNKRIKGKKGGYTNKYLFANKQLDEESDLQYFEKRYYDNRIGRFTTEDPVFWEVGLTKRPSQYYTDPQQWNSYSYVRNNPINYVDPTGEVAMVLAAPVVIIVVVTDATLLAMGSTVTVAGILYTVLGLSGNNVTLQQGASGEGVNSGAGTTSQGGTIANINNQSAVSIDELIVSATTTTAGSPPPSGGGNNGGGGKKNEGKKDGGNNTNSSKATPQDKIASNSQLEKIAKENGYKNAHDMKDAYLGKTGQNAKYDAFFTKDGELYFKSKPVGGREFEPIFTSYKK